MKAGRNDPCPCGSGKKYNKCCWTKDKDAESSQLVDVVQILREQLPDVYKDNDLHYLSLCLQDALVDGRRDAVSSLARELALDGGRDIDLLHQAFDGLAYHGCLPVLVEAHRTAWAS